MTKQRDMIFNTELYIELKRSYHRAVLLDMETFDFHGNILCTRYAKYLIQYLSGIFEDKK